MEIIRVYMTNDVPEAALAAIDKLATISAGDGVISGAGEVHPDENSVVLFYEAETGGKGEVRIPFSSIAVADEGVRQATMRRTIGVSTP